MTYDEIKTIFDGFIEFPEESDKLTVTTTSCILFARHVANIAAEREREACAPLVQANAEACDTYSTSRRILESNAAAIRARSEP